MSHSVALPFLLLNLYAALTYTLGADVFPKKIVFDPPRIFCYIASLNVPAINLHYGTCMRGDPCASAIERHAYTGNGRQGETAN